MPFSLIHTRFNHGMTRLIIHEYTFIFKHTYNLKLGNSFGTFGECFFHLFVAFDQYYQQEIRTFISEGGNPALCVMQFTIIRNRFIKLVKKATNTTNVPSFSLILKNSKSRK